MSRPDLQLVPVGSPRWQEWMAELWVLAEQGHFIVLRRLLNKQGRLIGYDWQVGLS